MVLVDSSAWIEAFRRKGRLDVKLAVESLLDAYEAMWCSPVRLEVLGGARTEERGLSVPWLDVVIAALALEDDVRLYAIDAHFARTAEITGLRHYTPR